MRAMSNVLSLRQAAELFGGVVAEPTLLALEADLSEELRSIRLFDDVAPTLTALRDRGIKIALCSNLAAPYGPPVLDLLPVKPDFCAWSYEAGAVKPQDAIYRYLCEGIDCRPDEVLMIGDTLDADMLGPRRFGMHGYHLDRRPGVASAEGRLHSLTQVLDHLG